MADHKWEVGTYFLDKEHFRDVVRTYAIHSGRNIRFVKNDKRRIRVRCVGAQGNCPWLAYCALLTSHHNWQLRKVVDVHTCSREFTIDIINSKWLSGTLETDLRENPSIKINEIRNKAVRKWNTRVSWSMARRARAMAADQVQGSFKEQFRRIYDYANELLKSNPGSTIKLKVEDVEGQATFNRFYTCLKACKDSFVSCRPIIGLDGCSLKGRYGGELLTAVGRDGNDQMLPLCYALVEVENKETWTWFMELLIEDLGGPEVCQSITFMSDQQKGLMLAIQEMLPGAEQRFCMRHLYAIFRKKFGGKKLKNLMWRAAVSTYPQAWEREMKNIKEANLEAYKYLIAIPPRFWSRSRFTSQAICDTLVNNMSEAFNSVIIDARTKPIVSMLEDIRIYLMKRWAKNRKKVKAFKVGQEKRFLKSSTFHLLERSTKSTLTHQCTCRKWMLSGIPCCHALAAMRFLNLNAEEFIPHWFRICTYEETYHSIIYPVNGQLLWERTSYNDVQPPLKRRLPGRPKKKRRLE
ncbi:uncharacterized protein LOC114189166 [Vigna unguiculata]|uniref:uncharacterized protein LOC114189166 n=1 Tax=Vigna unguiculata TaxID=3917 RepID=UPI00101718D3|nr:uncharacterized protein LOC114189166 [Vigna unguiculata]